MDHLWTRVPGAVSQELDGEVLVLVAERAEVLHLNPTAAVVWTLLAESQTVDTLVAGVLERFDGSPATVSRDVRALLDVLAAAGAVTAADPR